MRIRVRGGLVRSYTKSVGLPLICVVDPGILLSCLVVCGGPYRQSLYVLDSDTNELHPL